MLHKPLSLLFLLLSVGCGSGTSPTHAGFGSGTIEARVGPGGGTLRGAGGTPLAGFELRIPEGALREMVRLRVRIGEAMPVGDSLAASVPVAMTATPDPGALARPAELRVEVDFPAGRDPADLFVVGRQTTPATPTPAGPGEPRIRPALAAEFGKYEPTLRLFTAELSILSDVQVRRTREPRRVDDANALVGLGLRSLDRLTDESLERADQEFAAALQADPYYPVARLLRAVTRLLVVANDRRATGPGLQSIGEAATVAGLDVRTRSLLRRILDADWPRQATPSAQPPSAGDVLEMLQAELRPALLAGLADLAFVPLHTPLKIDLPGPLAGLAGKREIDAADFMFLRAAFAFGLFALDLAEDTDLRVDWDYLLSAAAADDTYEDLLRRFPDFGKLRAAPAAGTREHLTEALWSLTEAVTLLNAETDAQTDDLIVFSSSFDPQRRDRWQGNLAGLFASWAGGPASTLAHRDGPAMTMDLQALARGLDLRALAPRFAKFEPVAGSLPDPSLGGLWPELTQDLATEMFHFANAAELEEVQVTIDGDGRDWPASAEVLLPADPAGDGGGLANLDVGRVFVARRGTDLVLRVTLVEGAHRYDERQPRAFGFDMWVQHDRSGQSGDRVQFVVDVTEDGPLVTVTRNGRKVSGPFKAAAAGRELEVSLDRSAMLGANAAARDRVFRVFSWGLDRGTGAQSGDHTRRILFRY